MIQIILGAGLLNCLIGFLVLHQSKQRKDIVAFGIFCLVSGIWSLSNVLIHYHTSEPLFQSVYALGALGVSSMLAWSFLYREKRGNFWLAIGAYCLGAIIFFTSFIDGVIVGGVKEEVAEGGIGFYPGILFDAYNFYIFSALVWSIVNTVLAYRDASGSDKKRAKLVLIGLFGFAGTSVIVSAVLPAFGILQYTDFDSPSSLIFILFATIAIVKHHFLGTKVILTQILVSTLVVMSLIQMSSFKNSTDLFISIIILVIVFILGTFLIRSVTNDIKQKEELQRVNVQLKRSKQRLGQLNEHLLQLDQAKTDFINIASHQLRTPLGGMRWSMEMILANEVGSVSESVKKSIRQIYENNQRMGDLVNDLLNVARIEQGKVLEKPALTDIIAVIDDAVKMMQPEAKHKGIELKFKILSKNIASIMVAPKRFFEVIQNLISNAIKYNHTGGKVSVSVQVSKAHMRISIVDTGIGIPKNEQSKIFSKFFRAGNALSTNAEGTGLGLFVVKSFVEENGGIVRFKSKEGVGTTFIIELPLVYHSTKTDVK